MYPLTLSVPSSAPPTVASSHNSHKAKQNEQSSRSTPSGKRRADTCPNHGLLARSTPLLSMKSPTMAHPPDCSKRYSTTAELRIMSEGSWDAFVTRTRARSTHSASLKATPSSLSMHRVPKMPNTLSPCRKTGGSPTRDTVFSCSTASLHLNTTGSNKRVSNHGSASKRALTFLTSSASGLMARASTASETDSKTLSHSDAWCESAHASCTRSSKPKRKQRRPISCEAICK
mmetsp:Transcript_8402/g.23357  ORF Transcript_8402/g.23357 Transcript_8402/m.23357 type:complete len:231 (-) Transcript_8402:2609-3301(-)